MKLPLITDIQHYSIHDGDGIRTTVFFKGCTMACAWCHNPETQWFNPELMLHQERCTGCQRCVPTCPNGAITVVGEAPQTDRIKCVGCGVCVEACYNEAREVSGRTYEIPALVKLLEKDAMFSEVSGGGVTLSGGEVMAQDMDYIAELCRQLHRRGISVFIDTCGNAPFAGYERILPYVDVFLYDVKAVNDEVHQKYTGVSNRQILDNLVQLGRGGAKIYLRLPLIAGVNDSAADMQTIIDLLGRETVAVRQVNLLPYHALGQEKLERLGKTRRAGGFMPPTEAHLQELVELFRASGYQNTKIGG